ncbi:hypothetical protein [Tepidicaulis sp.]|uniref:hypothetical protein n=1 Tax=Tepidicaulis sp. TaxID=1920809 RepID=UPI003B5A350F
MRFIVALVFAFASMTGIAMADPMASFYGNTVVVNNPESGERQVHINEDGTYSQTLADGTSVEGTWEMKGEEVCFTSGENEPYCTSAESRSVGDTWELTNPAGVTETASLEEGR